MATKPAQPDAIVWLDLETTGLDRTCDVILEVGLIVTDPLGEELMRASTLVHEYSLEIALMNCDKFVLDMHTKSGLIEELNHAPSVIRPQEAESVIIAWLEEGVRLEKGVHPLAGSTINFDRGFLESRMPTLFNWFHYRNIDVTTLKNICKMVNPRVYEATPPKREQHRAIPDLEETIEVYKFYLDNFLHVHLPDETPVSELEARLAAQPETAAKIAAFIADPSTGVIWEGREKRREERRTRIVNE